MLRRACLSERQPSEGLKVRPWLGEGSMLDVRSADGAGLRLSVKHTVLRTQSDFEHTQDTPREGAHVSGGRSIASEDLDRAAAEGACRPPSQPLLLAARCRRTHHVELAEAVARYELSRRWCCTQRQVQHAEAGGWWLRRATWSFGAKAGRNLCMLALHAARCESW
jgi:hypothetical protein